MGKTITTAIFSLLKSLVWIAMTILFGLLQLWLIMLGSFIKEGGMQAVNAATHLIVEDNVLLFFSIAVISAMTVDFLMLMLQKKDASITTVNIITLICAFFIVVFSVAVYLHIYNIPAEMIQKNMDTFKRILILNFVISVFTTTYVFGLKLYQFFNRL